MTNLKEIEDSIEKVKLLIIQNSDNFEEYVENHGRDTEEMEESIWGQQQKRLYKQLDDLEELKKLKTTKDYQIPEINRLIGEHNIHTIKLREVEKKIQAHYRPILTKLIEEKEYFKILEIADMLPNCHFKAIVYTSAFKVGKKLGYTMDDMNEM